MDKKRLQDLAGIVTEGKVYDNAHEMLNSLYNDLLDLRNKHGRVQVKDYRYTELINDIDELLNSYSDRNAVIKRI